jgi:hypothetical protein
MSTLCLDIPTINFLRLRTLGKRMDPERIIRGNKTPIKKFNIDNPANLFMEILNKEEELKENQLQLVLWQRDETNKSYTEKREAIFEFTQFAASDQLYNLCRKEYDIDGKEFKIAKYAKNYYTWEEIKERDGKGNPVNLRKGPFNLRDGDWIGISYDLTDDFMTEEDKRMAEVVKIAQSVNVGTGKRKRQEEKLLIIHTDF